MGNYDLPVYAPLGPWTERAACKGMDPRIFYPIRGEDASEAKQVCASCFVRPECLHHAVVAPEKHGIWGGVSERKRRGDLTRLCQRCHAEYQRSASQRYCAECAPVVAREVKERSRVRRMTV